MTLITSPLWELYHLLASNNLRTKYGIPPNVYSGHQKKLGPFLGQISGSGSKQKQIWLAVN